MVKQKYTYSLSVYINRINAVDLKVFTLKKN